MHRLRFTMPGPLFRSIGLAGCLLAGLAQAGPAPWFVWRSKLDGKEVCAQASPGAGWVQQGGPFFDADCRKLPPRLLPM